MHALLPSVVARLLPWVLLLLGALTALPARADAGFCADWVAQDLPVAALPPAGTALTPLGCDVAAIRATLPDRDRGSWVQLRFSSAMPQAPVLMVETPLAPRVTLVLPDGRRLVRSKLKVPADGEASSLALSFPLPATLKAGEVLWLHVEDRLPTPLTLRLLDGPTWEARDRNKLVRMSVLSALLGAFALVALGYWVVLRQRMFGFYTLHVVTLLLFIGASVGFLYAWPGAGVLAPFGHRTQWALGAWSVGCVVAFARDFLGLRAALPRVARGFDLTAGVLLAGGLLVLPLDWDWFGMALSVVSLSVSVLLLPVAAAVARRGSRYAWYFLVGWGPLAAAGLMRALQGLGVSVPPDVPHLYAVGVVCEAVVLTLGLADQVLSIRRERDHALLAAAQARQLELQNEMLKENVKLREQVDRMSRHDLKTPLISIVSTPRLLHELGPLSPEQQLLLRRVERAGYRALNMVNLSLDLMKMEQGCYDWQPGPVDLAAVLQRVRADLTSLEAAHGVRVSVQRHGGLWPVARAEETLCYSILANLLKNAVEAAPSGSEVRVWFDTVETGWVGLHIHNEGAVPIEVRERFFDKYVSHGKRDGSGFGTYSARLMARMQQGEVLLRTSEREGTTLILRLKAASAEETEFLETGPASLAMPLAPLPEPEGALPQVSVLLVDDDEYNLLALRRCFPFPGAEVVTATQGREALQALSERAFDAVFLDLEMPGMSGFEVVQALRRHEQLSGEPPCFVVALSAHDGAAMREQALAQGFDRYATKPVSPEEVRQLLRVAARGMGREAV
ncbi:hybrid sensor histidine kinase/response regulator [Roseateles chitinivorans]|uniref:hybrid sensor histidine kinase/response regulator n=1 Tax=Roseateles chitinivorans TaxID=2917965 RepID=UPI0013046D66|nr:response regulator [Roseateles chitinivorans]